MIVNLSSIFPALLNSTLLVGTAKKQLSYLVSRSKGGEGGKRVCFFSNYRIQKLSRSICLLGRRLQRSLRRRLEDENK